MNDVKYRQFEKALWDSLGITPTERFVQLPRIETQVRVQEVGEGEPVLFIHGGPNSGSTWAPMIAHFGGFRSLVVDRPGTGLSEPHPLTFRDLPDFGAKFVGDVLTALGIDKAHVVASSFGGHLALRSAVAEPGRFERMVQMAAPAAGPGQTIPPFMKAMAIKPVRRLIGLLPPNQRATNMILRQIGHGKTLDAGGFPKPFDDWYEALSRYTDTMRNDGDLIGEVVPNGDHVELNRELLSKVTTPTLFLWGADDGFGDEENARMITGWMPHAELVMLPDAGHLPWMDEPKYVAEATARFLREETGPPVEAPRRAEQTA